MNLKKITTIASLLFLTILLTACGTRYPQSQATPAQTPRAVNSLPSDIGRFLSEGQDFQRQSVNLEAWGEGLELELQSAYFAASGRYCRPFTLYSQAHSFSESSPESFLASTSSGRESVPDVRLACKIRPGYWEEVRHILRGAQ